MYYPISTPKIVQWLFPNYIWRFPFDTDKKIYLTFDDGPIPKVTPWVLKQLAQYNAQATFFCVGANVKKNQEIYQQVLDAGHKVGNHTFNHLNGWASTTCDYLDNIEKCKDVVDSKLFRPPYGRLKPSQAREIKKNYKIVMWDIIAGDFDSNLNGEMCLKNVLNNASNGSIIVLHDSKKSWDRLEYILPKILDYYSKLGFAFVSIDPK
ncbi:MAG: polysaccharide deacetylase family protein [Saprospiraceae bacterium]|nr:polysaccharide deacetylase family protein [Saprospiraceae bacterium]